MQQSVVSDEGHPEGQQLWYLKLLALRLAEESLAGERQGEQLPRVGWGTEVVLSQPHNGPEASRHQAPPPKDCLPAAHSCARKSTTSTPALPSPCRPLCNGQLWKPGGGTAELYGMGLESGEHQEAGQSQLSLSLLSPAPPCW